MALYDISYNASSLDQAYAGVSTSAPWLFPLLLFFQFFVIMLAGIYAQNRRIGFSNVPMWGAIAGLVTTTSAFLYSAISGILAIESIGISLAVTIGFAAWFLLTSLDD